MRYGCCQLFKIWAPNFDVLRFGTKCLNNQLQTLHCKMVWPSYLNFHNCIPSHGTAIRTNGDWLKDRCTFVHHLKTSFTGCWDQCQSHHLKPILICSWEDGGHFPLTFCQPQVTLSFICTVLLDYSVTPLPQKSEGQLHIVPVDTLHGLIPSTCNYKSPGNIIN